MTDETEIPDDEEAAAEYYDPMPIPLTDGDSVIFDAVEFAELTESLAAMVSDGAMYVLRRDTLQWVNVKELRKPSTAVRAIPTRQ